jgi:hypothetical protein
VTPPPEQANAVVRAAREALPRIRRALADLPAVCRYHGDRLEPDRTAWGRHSCCDTGEPALHRRRAEEAVAALTAALDPPAGAAPDISADTGHNRGGHTRTPPAGEPAPDRGALPTRADTARTASSGQGPDTADGVRVEYRARVPRHLLGAAIAEAAQALSTARTTPPAKDPRS